MIHGDLKGVRAITHSYTPLPTGVTQPNIVIDASGNPRITDFGLTTIVRGPDSELEGATDGQGYTPRWAAPEVLRDSKAATRESDVFSLGMVMIEVGGNQPVVCQQPNLLMKVFTEKVPFCDMGAHAAMASIMNGERPGRPNHVDFTEPLWALTQGCWNKDARARPKIRMVLKVLKDLSTSVLHLYNECSTHASS